MYDHPLFSQVAQLPEGYNLIQGFDTTSEVSDMVRDLRNFCRRFGLDREIGVGANGVTVLVKSQAEREQ